MPTHPRQFTTGKVPVASDALATASADTLSAWIARYLALAVAGVRSDHVARKITLHLDRFQAFFAQAYGHDRLTTVLRRDVVAWREQIVANGLAPATVNNHLLERRLGHRSQRYIQRYTNPPEEVAGAYVEKF